MALPKESPPVIEDVAVLAGAILRMRREPPGHALLIGVSGVDATGNARAGRDLVNALETTGLRVARIPESGWRGLPGARFNSDWPARSYYEEAVRLDEMFDEVVLPLMFERRVHAVCGQAEAPSGVCGQADERSETSGPHRYDFEGVDVIVVESIFLYKRARRSLFDLAMWVDSRFDDVLDRAVERCDEGCAARIVRAYEAIFFPAQRIHLRYDRPEDRADVVLSTPAGVPGRAIAGVQRGRAEPAPRRATHGGGWRRSSGVARNRDMEWDEALVQLPL
jgi:uridine kinase